MFSCGSHNGFISTINAVLSFQLLFLCFHFYSTVLSLGQAFAQRRNVGRCALPARAVAAGVLQRRRVMEPHAKDRARAGMGTPSTPRFPATDTSVCMLTVLRTKYPLRGQNVLLGRARKNPKPSKGAESDRTKLGAAME